MAITRTEDLAELPPEWVTSLSDPCSHGRCAGCRHVRCGHTCHDENRFRQQ